MDRRRGGSRCDVLSCAVLCCAVNSIFYICCSKLVTIHNVFLAACSCFKHFINRYKYINIYIDIYTCMYIYMCVCWCAFVCAYGVVCVCLCVGVRVCDRVGVLCVCWRERREGVVVVVMVGGWVGVVFVVPSAVSLRTAETEQL